MNIAEALSPFLQQQFDAFVLYHFPNPERMDAEQERPPHSELEDGIAFGLTVYERLCESASLVQEDISSGHLAYSRSLSDYFASKFTAWLKKATIVEQVVRKLEEQGQSVARAAQLRECIHELLQEDLDVESTLASIQSIKEGRFKPLAEVTDELRRRPG